MKNESLSRTQDIPSNLSLQRQKVVYYHKGQSLLSTLNTKQTTGTKIIQQPQLHRYSFCWGFVFNGLVGHVGFSFQGNRDSKANLSSGLHTSILINNYLSYAVIKTHIMYVQCNTYYIGIKTHI